MSSVDSDGPPSRWPRSRLFEQIDAGAERSVERLARLAAIPSVSATGEGIEECADALAQLMRSLGIRTELLDPGGGAPLVWGTIGEGAPRVVVYGHYDVQPAGSAELWRDDPFEPVIRDGAIWGRGVGDNKGQLLAHLCALEAWLEAFGGPPPFQLVFAFDGEEEIGSPSSLPFIEGDPEHFGGDFLYGADGSTLGLSGPAVFLGVRGLLYVELEVRGVPTEWHSGSYGGVLPNPIQRLAAALTSLADVDGTVRVDGFYAPVKPPSDADRRLADELPATFLADPAQFGSTQFRTPDPREAMFFRPQFCVCGITGGYGEAGVKTAVPTEARAKIDITIVPGQEPEAVVAQLRAHLDAAGFADVELTTLTACPPVSTAADDPYVQRAIAALATVWDTKPVIFPSIGGGGPLAGFVRAHGMPSLMVPYAQGDLNEHSAQEHLDLEWFANGIKTSAELFRLLSVDATGGSRRQ
jgi:acetylornithine deacetylase/succinyl-diaminopimelate desuccinylase-like protein